MPAAREDFFEHARIEKERRAEIELVAVRLDARRAPADDGKAFEDFHAHARGREENGRGKTAGPAPMMMACLVMGMSRIIGSSATAVAGVLIRAELRPVGRIPVSDLLASLLRGQVLAWQLLEPMNTIP